jgi:hypothetical protein
MLWSALLLVSQATDTLTTAMDRARGAIEASPVSARLLEVGGIALFWGIKVLIVASAAAALWVAARKVRDEDFLSRLTYRACLAGVQVATISLAGVSMSNLILLSSIRG